ncbi:MAG: glycosyltransferase [Thermodesulfobacteriota bacterium]
MAKVLICYFFGGSRRNIPSLYDGLKDKFLENGNDVVLVNIDRYIKRQGFSFSLDKGRLGFFKEKIDGFSPDLVLSFNNAFPAEMWDEVDGKLCILDADNPEYFWNKEALKNKRERFFYLGFQRYSEQMYRSFFEGNFDLAGYAYFPPATNVKAEKLPKTNNISFIGTNFNAGSRLKSVPDKKLVSEIYLALKSDYFYNPHRLFQELSPGMDENRFHEIFETVKAVYIREDRLKYLDAIADLGLVIYGDSSWNNISSYDLALSGRFDETPVFSLEENSRIYNSSKISINISHPQAVTSFSWRVMDIMASSSCLVMEKKPDWDELFGERLSDEVIEAIIYKDRFDMREKCKRLLSDDSLRERCVRECREAIEKKGRWEERFEILEGLLGLKLIGCENENPSYAFYALEDNELSKSKLSKSKTGPGRFPVRFKYLRYVATAYLSEVPFLSLFIDKERAARKLEKYHLKNAS